MTHASTAACNTTPILSLRTFKYSALVLDENREECRGGRGGSVEARSTPLHAERRASTCEKRRRRTHVWGEVREEKRAGKMAVWRSVQMAGGVVVTVKPRGEGGRGCMVGILDVMETGLCASRR